LIEKGEERAINYFLPRRWSRLLRRNPLRWDVCSANSRSNCGSSSSIELTHSQKRVSLISYG
jgi:hypothetical protein